MSTSRIPVEGTATTLAAVAEAQVDLRAALRRFAKAVVIITCRFEGTRYAMAATAVSEISMSPPSMLVCVNRNASIYEPLTRTDYFGINILHSTQHLLAHQCSGAIKGEARFASGAWLDSIEGVPYLGDAQASIICRKNQQLDYGTHGIFLGPVCSVQVSGEVSPLIYMDGRYVSSPSDVQ